MPSDGAIPVPPQYDRILGRSRELEFSLNSDVLTGSLLRALATTKPGGAMLELGTGCGLGTCWLLDGMTQDSHLLSIDTDSRVQQIAREQLGADQRLTLLLADGGQFLEQCSAAFDLIYADALPGKFTHLDTAIALLKPGGIYIIDDLLPQPNWPSDHDSKVAALIAALVGAPGLNTIRLAWSTGVMLAVKR